MLPLLYFELENKVRELTIEEASAVAGDGAFIDFIQTAAAGGTAGAAVGVFIGAWTTGGSLTAAALAGAGFTVIGTGLAAWGYIGYAAATAMGLDTAGSAIGRWIYDTIDSGGGFGQSGPGWREDHDHTHPHSSPHIALV